MEKHHFTFFKFSKENDYYDIIDIGLHKSIISPRMSPHLDYLGQTDYYPKSKRNMAGGRSGLEDIYNEYSAFLEKLFQFAEKEKIKRIRTNYNIELKTDEKLGKNMEWKRVIFKVSGIIIEKKTTSEIETEV